MPGPFMCCGLYPSQSVGVYKIPPFSPARRATSVLEIESQNNGRCAPCCSSDALGTRMVSLYLRYSLTSVAHRSPKQYEGSVSLSRVLRRGACASSWNDDFT